MELIYFYVFCATAMLFSTLALLLSFLSLAKCIGMEKSTHKIQYVPLEEPKYGAPSLDEGIGMTNENATQMMKKLYPKYEDEL